MEAIADVLTPITHEARSFRNSFKTVKLSTATIEGIPTASYAPFTLLSENEFGIYISDLAVHAHNLAHNPKASLLFVGPENTAQPLFARQRLAYICNATMHHRDSDTFNEVLNAMKQHFRGVTNHLEKMQDFHVFTLSATHASYVKGFAQAYEFKGADLNMIRHAVVRQAHGLNTNQLSMS